MDPTLTLLLSLPYILARLMREGVVVTVTYLADAKALPVWAERAQKAHYNAVENLAPFAACCDRCAPYPDRECHDCDGRGHLLGAGCAYIGYISGLPFVCTLTFTIGWLATFEIFLVIGT